MNSPERNPSLAPTPGLGPEAGPGQTPGADAQGRRRAALDSFLGPAPRDTPRNETIYRIVTRCVDMLVAATVLLAALPCLLLVGMLIRLDSPGPVLFRGARVAANRRRARPQRWPGPERRDGQHGCRTFRIYKFRTMQADAQQQFPARYAYRYSEEQLWTLPMKALLAAESGVGDDAEAAAAASDGDPRLTRVGRWLRRTSIDELPNLINVLRGEVSLVGGRPEHPRLLPLYLPEHHRKFDLKPGVTGLAQVLGRGNLTFHQINAYDAEFVDHHCLRLYFWILWRTARVVLTAEGAL